MSLDLDTRRRAMLQEMGLRVWLPAPAVAPVAAQASPLAERVTSVAQVAPQPTHEKIAARAITTRAGAEFGLKSSTFQEIQAEAVGVAGVRAGAEVADLAWPALAQAIGACQACALCDGRRAAVLAAPDAPQRADWLVVSEPPDDADEQAGAPLAGAPGQLLDNMLKALGLSRHASATDAAAQAAGAATAAYLTSVVRCRPAQPRNPSLAELAICEQYLRREVALVQPKIILALGRFAAQSLLQGSVPDLAGSPLGQLRGQIYHYQGVPVIVSYPPSYLLRSPQNKGRAWVDWCRAQAVLRGGA